MTWEFSDEYRCDNLEQKVSKNVILAIFSILGKESTNSC